MYTLKTEDGDISLNQSGEGDFLYIEEAAKQIVVNAFYMWFEEWFLEPSHGVKWLEIQGKGRTTQEILQLVQSALVKNPYIQKVVDLSIEYLTLQDKRENKANLVYTVIMDKRNITGAIVT